MSKCRYDLSEDCNNTDCIDCVLGKIRAEIEQIELLARYTRGDIKQMALDVIEKYKAESEGEDGEID